MLHRVELGSASALIVDALPDRPAGPANTSERRKKKDFHRRRLIRHWRIAFRPLRRLKMSWRKRKTNFQARLYTYAVVGTKKGDSYRRPCSHSLTYTHTIDLFHLPDVKHPEWVNAVVDNLAEFSKEGGSRRCWNSCTRPCPGLITWSQQIEPNKLYLYVLYCTCVR